jgi:regulator of sigma E protease
LVPNWQKIQISLNLFLINLLPVPVLDGGHLVCFTIEGLKGTPVSLRKMEIAQQVGLMILMLLMAFAFFNDITNFFFQRW